MDDISPEVVITGRNEYFGAGDGVASITERFGFRFEQRKVGSGTAFGERHRSGPFATDHPRKIERLEFVGRMRGDSLRRASCEAWEQPTGKVGGGANFVERSEEHR